MLVLVWAKTWFTRGMTVLFIALIIACYFIPEPAGAWVMRLFVLFLGCARALPMLRACLAFALQAMGLPLGCGGACAQSHVRHLRVLRHIRGPRPAEGQ